MLGGVQVVGLPVGGLKEPPQLDVQVQVVGLPDAVAVNCTPIPSHQGEGVPATTVGVAGIGLIVKEYWALDVPHEFVAVTFTTHWVDEVTVGAV
jgi:hypothetical protein